MKNEFLLRKELVEICARIYQKGFIAATDGNVSVKLDYNRVLFTPGGVCKGFLKPFDLIVTDMDGNKVSGNGTPTSEIYMHLAAYREREDIKAVVHAHPPLTVAFTYSGVDLSDYLLPEVIITLGTIPTAPYSTTGTMELAAGLGSLIKGHDAVILEKHGLVTVGKDLNDAYFKLEKTEHNAQVIMAAKQLGRIEPLSRPQVDELLELRRRMGYR